MNEQETTPPSTPSNPPVTKSEVIRQIARALQERRSARSLTLDKVSQTIKIRMPFLEALERGEWDQLPGEVFVRGFVRRYAQYLGLDGDKLIAPYVALSDAPIEKKEAPSIPAAEQDVSRTQLVWGFLGVLIIIGFLKVLKHDRDSGSVAVAPPAPTQPQPVSLAPVEEAVEPKVSLKKHQLDVFSPFPLWLRVTAADKTFEGFIPQTTTWTWRAEGGFTIRLGHTKEVMMIFDGKPIALVDDQKKVVLP